MLKVLDAAETVPVFVRYSLLLPSVTVQDEATLKVPVLLIYPPVLPVLKVRAPPVKVRVPEFVK